MTPLFTLPDLDEALLLRLLARALGRGGDYADLFAEASLERALRWEEGRLREGDCQLTRGLGIRVLAGAQTGYAYSEDFSEGALMAAADTAAHIARGAPRGQALASLCSPAIPDRYPVQRQAVLAELEAKVAPLREAEAAVAGREGVVKLSASYHESRREILVASSEGVLVRDSQPMLRFNCNVVMERQGRRESGHASDGGRRGLDFFEDESAAAIAGEARRLAELKLEAREAPAGPMPVVLGPASSGILLHEAVGHGLEADFNRKGTSKFSGQIGERVASELCTVVDDPTLPGDRGAINVDDEGTPAERTVLIEAGILRGYMHDRLSARLMDAALTGNGRRESFRHHPMPRMTNTYLLAGESEPEEILASTERGLYAKQFSGGQVDIARGDFVFDVTEGYLIEGGRVTAPVKGATLVGNGPEVMGRVTMVGKDFAISPGAWTCGKRGQRVSANVGLPHVKIAEITVGGTRAGEGP